MTMFAWEDLVMFAVAFHTLMREAVNAKTLEDIDNAAMKFAKKAGQVGFDIAFMIGTWGLGKVASRTLQPLVAERAVTVKQRQVNDLDAGASAAKQHFNDLRRQEATGDPTTILDAANRAWDTGAQAGLRKMRQEARAEMTQQAAQQGRQSVSRREVDARVLNELESAAKAEYITPQHYLQAKAAGKEPTGITKAKQDLTRAEMARDGLADSAKVRAEVRVRSARVRLRPILGRIAKNSKMYEKLNEVVRVKGKDQLPGEIAEMIARDQVAKTLSPNQSVSKNSLVVVEEIPGFQTIEAFRAAQVQAGQPKPVRFTLREGGGKVWRVLAEIDVAVFEKGPGGKRIALVEEVKSGSTAQPTDAAVGLAKVQGALQKVANGNAKVHENTSLSTLGKDVGSGLDWSQSSGIKYQHRGPADKTGFNTQLPYEAASFRAVIFEWWDSLPPRPTTPVTVGPLMPDEGDDARP